MVLDPDHLDSSLCTVAEEKMDEDTFTISLGPGLETNPLKQSHPAHVRQWGGYKLLTPLLEHQKVAVDWMRMAEIRQRGGILADDMGLGKTYTSVANMLSETVIGLDTVDTVSRSVGPALIVCTKSLMAQWKDEITSKTNIPEHHIMIYHGKRRQKKRLIADNCLRAEMKSSTSSPQGSTASELMELKLADMFATATPYSSLDSNVSFAAVITTYDTLRMEYSSYIKEENARRLVRDAKRRQDSILQRFGNASTANIQQSNLVDSESTSPESSSFAFLFTTHWNRTILDESHIVRAKDSQNWQAAMSLTSTYRWAVTGTPYNNGVSDLQSLANFLRIAPYDRSDWWLKFGTNDSAVAIWREQCMLRRTKEILNLPPITHEVIQCPFSPAEQTLYNYIKGVAMKRYLQYRVATGRNKLQMFGSMLSHMLKLRQVCDHPLLLLGRYFTRPLSTLSQSSSTYIEGSLAEQSCIGCGKGFEKAIPEQDDGSKMIQVTETVIDPPMLRCGHRCCRSCYIECSNARSRKSPLTTCDYCVLCREWKRSICSLTSAAEDIEDPASDEVQVELTTPTFPIIGDVMISSKIAHLLEVLSHVCHQTSTSTTKAPKIVIFSQWTTSLDILEHVLTKTGFGVVRYDGDVATIERRNSYVREFQNDPSKQIFLASLQAGGLGLNLAVANTVILYDAWFNPATEDQAVDRIHRLGQQDNVRVIHLVTPDTIEVDVSRIQQRKREASNSLFSENRWTMEEITNSTDITGANNISEDDIHSIFQTSTLGVDTSQVKKTSLLLGVGVCAATSQGEDEDLNDFFTSCSNTLAVSQLRSSATLEDTKRCRQKRKGVRPSSKKSNGTLNSNAPSSFSPENGILLGDPTMSINGETKTKRKTPKISKRSKDTSSLPNDSDINSATKIEGGKGSKKRQRQQQTPDSLLEVEHTDDKPAKKRTGKGVSKGSPPKPKRTKTVEQ